MYTLGLDLTCALPHDLHPVLSGAQEAVCCLTSCILFDYYYDCRYFYNYYPQAQLVLTTRAWCGSPTGHRCPLAGSRGRALGSPWLGDSPYHCWVPAAALNAELTRRQNAAHKSQCCLAIQGAGFQTRIRGLAVLLLCPQTCLTLPAA